MSALLVPNSPAPAFETPAYGLITIVNEGLGVVTSNTYDPGVWACRTTVSGQYLAPTSVTVTCQPYQVLAFSCPWMIVTARTNGFAARAGGRARCSRTIETPVVTGYDTAFRSGDLGHVYSTLECTAFGGGLPLAPPYSVTCLDPGAPAVSL